LNAPDPYRAFLEAKIASPASVGLPCELDEVQSHLTDGRPMKEHVRHIVRWAVQGGRRGIFASFGLQKTMMQLEIGRLITTKTGCLGLIVLPLGVRREFMIDAALLDIKVAFVKSDAEIDALDPDNDVEPPIFLTNYESVREGKIDVGRFGWASLDEASVLRSYGSKTYQEFLPLFDAVPYRHVATATPSPNRYKELIHYAGFLGVMDTGQALTRFFQRNSEKANDLTLYPHKEAEFWLWLNSWGVFLQKPSDLGFSDEGYDLPPFEVRYHMVEADLSDAGTESNGQRRLIADAAIGVVDASRAKRKSIDVRIAKVAQLLRPQGLHAGVSQDIQTSGEDAGAEGGRSTAEAGAVCRQSSAAGKGAAVRECSQPDSSAGKAEKPSEVVRDHPRRLPSPVAEAGQRLCDLPQAVPSEEEARSRSLPPDREGTRASLPALQSGDRPIPGECEAHEGGDSLSEQCIIWCDLNDEQKACERAVSAEGLTYSSLTGTQSLDKRELTLEEWRRGETAAFISKPTMYGAGVNLQRCNRMIFAGIGFKFQDFIQSIHRIHRFGQERPCVVDVIYSETETEVLRSLQQKWQRHDELMARMSEIIREFGLNHDAAAESLKRTIGCEREEASGSDGAWSMVRNDCVDEVRRMPDNSVDLIVTSVPFGNHYEYSESYNDFGHTDDHAHFFAQMDFLTPELLRILKPGRIAAIHVKDRIQFASVTGMTRPTVEPFHADTIAHFRRHGFGYMGLRFIATDVVRENNQTYRLTYKELRKDSSKMGCGSPEFLLLFFKLPTDRSNGYADEPVTKDAEEYSLARWQIDADALWRSSGDRPLTADELALMPPDALAKLFPAWSVQDVYDHEAHVAIGEGLAERQALPKTFSVLKPGCLRDDVWTDVARMRTLNSEQSRRRVEAHICPLQFDIVDRTIRLYSNPGDLVFDPFAGLGTVPMRALKLGRRGFGVELNEVSWRDAVHYCREAAADRETPSLFAMLEMEAAA